MEHAVNSRRPRARYVVPFSSNLPIWLAAITPTRIYDAIMRWATGLNRPQLPPATQKSLPARA